MNYRNRPIIPIHFVSVYNPIEVPIQFEDWKLIDEVGVIKNYYFISNFGRVKNINGYILKPEMINSGYLIYKLYTGSLTNPRYKKFLAHRLVMMYFHPISNPDKMTVNHEDLDPTNNFDGNLSWMSQKDNNDHKLINSNKTRIYGNRSTFNDDQLKIIFRELDNGTSYREILDIIEVDNTPNNRDYIGNIKRGKTYVSERTKYQMNKFND